MHVSMKHVSMMHVKLKHNYKVVGIITHADVSMMHVSMKHVSMIHMKHISMMRACVMHVKNGDGRTGGKLNSRSRMHVCTMHIHMLLDNDAYVHDAYICDIQSLTMLHVCMMRLKFCDGDSRSFVCMMHVSIIFDL